MFDFQQKRKLRSVFNSRITQVVLIILILFMSWSAYGRFLVAKEMSEKRVILEKEITKLEERQKSLSEEVEYISSERGMEAEIRRQFDVARKGEQVVVIMEDEDVATTVEPLPKTEKEASRPWYKFW
ncbi:MAG: septum formation initiator family protein [Candidatus Paceibacterota bacterium]